MAPTISVELHNVSKRFGHVVAVDKLNLQLMQGEFFALLGPSGCGKTTTLRLIGGLEQPDAGEIRLAGAVVTRRPPYARRTNIVFQNYALFPHLSVLDNVAFGLRLQNRRLPRAQLERLVHDALELVQLGGLGPRRPHQLSGGQQQRVALARALVLRPEVLLLDEPLGALDRQLRKTMQSELRRIQRDVQTTFLYVTHDQEEALSMADRIAVMRQGTIEQLGTPQAVYETPRTVFVAEFMGATNVLSGQVMGVDRQTVALQTPAGLRTFSQSSLQVTVGQTVRFVIRPEAVHVIPRLAPYQREGLYDGYVYDRVYLGDITEITVVLSGGDRVVSRMASRVAHQHQFAVNDQVRVGWEIHDCQILAE